ncbi:MAG TPA: hypothetical protein VM925_04965, partial [Labilithrix sp.]|nr:hypothetical protein [Labilithrix sp.]
MDARAREGASRSPDRDGRHDRLWHDAPVVRSWLARPAEVINRLTALGAFTKGDCSELGARWSEKLAPDGKAVYA